MTEKRWKQIEQWVKVGDPLKDIKVNESELIDYIIELRNQISKLKEFEWKYKELSK
jgi:hypothetical protein